MELMQLALQIYSDYFGQGMVMWLFVASLFYLWFREKNKTTRYLLVFLTSALLVLFFFPVFVYVAVHTLFGEVTYYRILWLVPIYPTIAYAGTKLIMSIQKYWMRVGAVVLVCGVVVLSGQYTYSHISFMKAENIYHVPQVTVDLCDAIVDPDDWTDMVVSRELLESIKQYSATVRIPYGREMLIESWGFTHPLYDAMEAEVIDVPLLTELAKEYHCEYIVLREDAVLDGDMSEFGYETLMKVGWYLVYERVEDESMS